MLQLDALIFLLDNLHKGYQTTRYYSISNIYIASDKPFNNAIMLSFFSEHKQNISENEFHTVKAPKLGSGNTLVTRNDGDHFCLHICPRVTLSAK